MKLLCLALACCTAGLATAQLISTAPPGDISTLATPGCDDSWTLLPNPAPGPPGRIWTTMAFDSARGRSVLFGGRIAPDGALNDTWEWDGNTWHHVAQDTGPTERVYGNMVYDAARQEIIFFGGRRPYSGVFLGETWAWNGVQWTLKSSTGPAREGFAMAYDSVRQRVVIFGGHNGQYRNDVWEWDGTAWTDRTPSTGPAPMPRDGVAMAFDPNLNATVVFGGFGNNGQPLSDVWLWNGTSWTSDGSRAGGDRFGHSMAFDSNVGQVVNFGGAYFGTTTYSDLTTLQFDGVLGTLSPLARHGAGLCFDSVRNRLVLTHGSAGGVHRLDTWEFDGVQWIPRSGPAPSPRAGANMIVHPELQIPMLFGGFTEGINGGDEALDDAWIHRDGVWGQVDGTFSPVLLPAFAVQVANDKRIFRYGGLEVGAPGPNVVSGILSFLSRNFWVGFPADGPPRWGAASCWYDSRDCMVIVGGEDQTNIRPRRTLLSTLGGVNEAATLNPFDAIEGSAMGYDPIRDEAVLAIPTSFGTPPETWRLKIPSDTYQPIWTPLGTAGLTPDHASPWLQMSWNPRRGRLMLLTATSPVPNGDNKPFIAMEWNGQSWVELPAPNAPVWTARPALSSGGPNHAMLVFGGARFPSSCGGCIEHTNAIYEFGGSNTFTIAQSSTPACRDTITLTVQDATTPNLTFAWSRNGIPISDGLSGSGSTYVGSQSSALRIQHLSARDSAYYTCVVSNLCGSSDGLAVLGGKVVVPYCCPADLTEDTYVDDSDFVLFAAAYDLLVCDDPSMPPLCPADLTGDGFVDDADFVAFADAYNQLLCD